MTFSSKTMRPYHYSITDTNRSFKDEVSVTSKWGVGWQTPAFILFCYISAVLTALAHLILFKFLHGSRADEPYEILPQSYINNISHLLASIFQIALQGCLGAVFVQYLWFILRRSALSVSTIETLFLLRSEPLSIFKFEFKFKTLKITSLLLLVASFSWSVYVVAIFPPGALTIGQVPFANISLATVPTFNGSFVGDASTADVINYGLDVIHWDAEEGFSSVFGWISTTTPKLLALARNVLLNGVNIASPSPCGPNCTYTTQFLGPFFDCNSSISNITYGPPITNNYTIYNGTSISWATYYSAPYFSATSESILALGRSPNTTYYSTEYMITSRQSLLCAPVSAQYTVRYTYQNGVQSRSSSHTRANSHPIWPIGNAFNVTLIDDKLQKSQTPANFTKWYTDLNILNIANAAIASLSGESFSGNPQSASNMDTKIAEYGDLLWSLNNTWPDESVDFSQPRPIIADSKFNAYLNSPINPATAFPNISYAITPELLNEYLLNLTLSVIPSYGYWNTTTNVTTTTLVNIYHFTSPLTLILPYSISLAIALPFVILGLYALINNGVPATDGGFIPLITTLRSSRLENEASIGCLGGEENVSKKLGDMKVMFGELADGFGDDVVRRAGFGTEEEVLPLRKGAKYGKSVRVRRVLD